MTFEEAVAATPDLDGAWRDGLGALRRADKEHISAADPRLLSGSVDVDTALTKNYPNANRWDYGIGSRPTNLKEEVVYWFEVHPASDGEVKVVLAKLTWLKTWLRENSVPLGSMRRNFIWISSGRTSFTSTSPQQRQFALQGLQHTGGHFRIPATFVL
jgi:hypothetical protein